MGSFRLSGGNRGTSALARFPLMALMALMANLGPLSWAAIPDRPNIIFIMADDLGPEWISAYGASLIQTPNIDKLAETGLKFDGAYSMPKCTPTRVTLLTGQYPFRHGWVNHWDVPRWSAMDSSPRNAYFDWEYNLTFARVMKSRGYATAIAGKWQINDFRTQPDALERHGFDEWAMWTGSEGGQGENHEKISDERYWDPYVNIRRAGEKPGTSVTRKGQFGPDIFLDFVIDFMGRNRTRPQMIYYPMVLPHAPLVHTPLEMGAGTEMGKHKAMVRYIDHEVGRLVKALDSLDLRKRTLVFFTTDNGTGTNITGKIGTQIIQGGKGGLTDNGCWEPFIVNAPGIVPAGTTSALTDFTDLFPTFAELAGATLPKSWTLDGKSIAKVILGEDKVGSREWILAMGGGEAVYEAGVGIKPVKAYATRVMRDREFKVYVVDNQITRLVRVDNIPEDSEGQDLSDSKDPEVLAALARFRAALTFPAKDSRPVYSTARLPDMPGKIDYNPPVDPTPIAAAARSPSRTLLDQASVHYGDRVHVTLPPGDGEVGITLYNMMGNRIRTSAPARDGTRMSLIPATRLAGIYFVELTSGREQRLIRLFAEDKSGSGTF